VGVREFWYGLKSTQWPSCEGTIIKSKVKRSRGSDGWADFNPQVVYVYWVGGQEFVSRRVAFHGFGGTTAFASASVCSRYPSGAHVRVFYDPRNSARSTLEVGYGLGNAITIGIGLFLGFAGILAYLSNM
jgi:hypothetical protein